MIERRKFEMAPLIMWDALSSSGYQPNSEDVKRRCLRDSMHLPVEDEDGPLTAELHNLMNNLLSGGKTSASSVGFWYQKLAYRWLLLMWSQKNLPINNNLRREIGNTAKRLQISEVQTIEFFRLLLTDIVSRALFQADDEVPLERQG